jgi:hypothetical protein
MLHPADDYPLHQAPLPLRQTVSGDPNHYDRYFFHGYDADSGRIFVAALGVYPNRHVIDAAFCVSHDGNQRSVFASGRLTRERATRIGPITVDVVEPMRRLEVHVDAPAQGLAAELTFEARTAAVQEPRQTMMDRTRLVMDTCRFTQFGRWRGSLRSGEDQVTVTPERWAGTRDRSWGVRPLTGATPAAPATTVGGIWWLWAPLQLPDRCVHVAIGEDNAGVRTLAGGAVIGDLGSRPAHDADATIEHARSVDYDLTWEPGRRRAQRAIVTLERLDRTVLRYDLEPVGRILMRGAGYTHLEWGHGAWHGEEAVGGEELRHADLAPDDFTGMHVQQVVRVSGAGDGVGVLEELHLGAHPPTGLTGFVDPPA